MSSDIEHWHINATVYRDRVEETHYISDPAKNIRRKPETTIWHVERFLGRGTFGEVRLEKNRADGKVRAVKRISTSSTSLNNSECEKELKALLEFSKPKVRGVSTIIPRNAIQAYLDTARRRQYLLPSWQRLLELSAISREAAVFVDFFGWFKDQSDMFLAMEYIPLGDLETNIKAHSGKLSEVEARDITEQILLGLEIMHAEHFAHRDLKPQNILVVHGPPQWWIKIADFGLSKRLTDTTKSYTRGGSQPFMAPEIHGFVGTRRRYTNAIDIWALGCMVHRMVTGCVPFPLVAALGKYCAEKSLFPYDALLDSGIKGPCFNFIRELLVPDPSGRPSASEALKNQWIAQVTEPFTSSSRRSSTPDELSDPVMSQLRFDTASHAGLQSDHSSNSGDESDLSSVIFDRRPRPYSHALPEIKISNGARDLPEDTDAVTIKPTPPKKPVIPFDSLSKVEEDSERQAADQEKQEQHASPLDHLAARTSSEWNMASEQGVLHHRRYAGAGGAKIDERKTKPSFSYTSWSDTPSSGEESPINPPRYQVRYATTRPVYSDDETPRPSFGYEDPSRSSDIPPHRNIVAPSSPDLPSKRHTPKTYISETMASRNPSSRSKTQDYPRDGLGPPPLPRTQTFMKVPPLPRDPDPMDASREKPSRSKTQDYPRDEPVPRIPPAQTFTPDQGKKKKSAGSSTDTIIMSDSKRETDPDKSARHSQKRTPEEQAAHDARKSTLSTRNFFTGLLSSGPKNEKTASKAISSARPRKDRTPEEQAAHEYRKEARRKRNEKEASLRDTTKEAPMHPRWAEHRDFAAEYMQAARRKASVDAEGTNSSSPQQGNVRGRSPDKKWGPRRARRDTAARYMTSARRKAADDPKPW